MLSGGKGKGLNRFSALSINENARTSLDVTGSSESGSKGVESGEGEGEGSEGLLEFHPPLWKQLMLPTTWKCHSILSPPLLTSFWPPHLSFLCHPTMFQALHMQQLIWIQISLVYHCVSSTPTTFTSLMAPSSFNSSSISSIKPSSSISAHIEVSHQKWKADYQEIDENLINLYLSFSCI